MPLLRINATPHGLTLHDTPQPAGRRLCAMASQHGPAIIMVHGYKYRPASTAHCPHRKIFGADAKSWPAQLDFGTSTQHEGIGIAFGWDARGTLRKVHNRASALGESLAIIVAMLRHHTPHRPVRVIAHSLGAEVALSALEYLPNPSIDRMVLLNGASYTRRAAACLRTPAGLGLELLNVTSRENDVFDAAFERLVPARGAPDKAIGHGIDAPNATTVQLDCGQTLQGFKTMGFDIAPPSRRICHWSTYTRPGVMALYAQFLRDPIALPFDGLVHVLPRHAAPRWSRFLTHRARATSVGDMPLPPAAHALRSVRRT